MTILPRLCMPTHIFQMGLFEGFREPGWNTYYEMERRPVSFDMNQVLVVFFATVLVVVMVVLVVGSKGTEVGTSTMIEMTVPLVFYTLQKT